ncbi:MAG: ATP-dependent DNA helicase RecG [Proteobacteria bacterium]|nr:ATP-dependent DNA helicase RecG [Pseudomonadota bacterium]
MTAESGLIPALKNVAGLLDEQAGLPSERIARGLHKAVGARLEPVDEALLSPKSRNFLRRLRRSFADFDRLEADEREGRLKRTRDAVHARIRRGDEPDREAVEAPRRKVDSPARDVLSAAAVPVSKLKGVGPVKADQLAAAGIHTVADLLHHLPRKYQDRTCATPIQDVTRGEEAVVFGEVTGIRSGRGRRTRFAEVAVDDGTGTILATWFGSAPWIHKAFTKGDAVCLMGGVDKKAPPLRMTHPEFEKADADTEGVHRGVVVPMYGLPEGIGQRALRGLIHRAFEDFAEDVDDVVPETLRDELGLPSRAEALRAVHFPEGADDVPALRLGSHPAHEALLFEDLFVLQTALARRRAQVISRPCSAALWDFLNKGSKSLQDRLIKHLPFELTGAQQRVLAELGADLSDPRPMQRLVQGDVGAGKTVVALLAAASIVDRGDQVAVLAPTEVLAWQWYDRARAMYERMGRKVALLTGGQRAAARRHHRGMAADGVASIIVGTHAIFQDAVEFGRLGLAIVDEQHRFGVFQRASLLSKGGEPHLLAMTATPIPRSLALTMFGDLDISTIDERPPRGELTTDLWGLERHNDAWAIVRAAAEADERAYIICPRVEGKGTGHAAVDLAEQLAMGALAGLRLGILHGRMDGSAKDEIIRRFRDGEVQVLVSTTVVEVGVDVPEATAMVIMDAERFGLAQLHQLRGRVGRSTRGGRCVLLAERPDEVERLAILTGSNDGFAIAAEDLRLRGPGDLVGARQSGAPAFSLFTTPRFAELVEITRTAARAVVERDDFEEAEELAPLRRAADERLELGAAAEAG